MVAKTIEIELTPTELAAAFCDMADDEQAAFFAHIKTLSDGWPNSGFCGQACAIVRASNPDARYILGRLADHLNAA